LAEHGADFGFPLPERFQVILAMVEDDAAEGMIDAVINVVARFSVADGFADNARY